MEPARTLGVSNCPTSLGGPEAAKTTTGPEQADFIVSLRTATPLASSAKRGFMRIHQIRESYQILAHRNHCIDCSHRSSPPLPCPRYVLAGVPWTVTCWRYPRRVVAVYHLVPSQRRWLSRPDSRALYALAPALSDVYSLAAHRVYSPHDCGVVLH